MDKSKFLKISQLAKRIVIKDKSPDAEKIANSLEQHDMGIIKKINEWAKSDKGLPALKAIVQGKAQAPKKAQPKAKASGDSVKEATSYPHNPPSAPYRG